MSKNKKLNLDYKHLFISSSITIALAELIPAMFIGLIILWQGQSFGSLPESYNFLQKGSYTIQELLKYGNFAVGLGVLFTVGVLIYLSTLIVDEWFFSHELNDFSTTIFYSIVWGAGYYLIDSVITSNLNKMLTISAFYANTSFKIAFLVFAIPLVMYFVRKFLKNRN